MGSLENGTSSKRPSLLRQSSSRRFFHKPRSRIYRFLLLEKFDYFQWLCVAAFFFFVFVLFQAFLPASVVGPVGSDRRIGLLEELRGLEFGDGLQFVPSRLLEKFDREEREANSSMSGGRRLTRAGVIRPRIAVVFADLNVMDGAQLQMVTVAVALREIGYDVEILALEDGIVHSVWTSAGFPVHVVSFSMERKISVDWLRYNAVIVNSLESKPVLSCLSQEPFRRVPVIWAVYEKTLAFRLEQYIANNKSKLINDWRQSFARATVVAFPNHLFPMLYSALDAGNYYIIPSNPDATWSAADRIHAHDKLDKRREMGFTSEDFVIVIAGNEFSYSGRLLEQALVLQAIVPLFQNTPFASYLKIAILNKNSTNRFIQALEEIAIKIGFPNGSIKHINFDDNTSNTIIDIADIVIYGSFFEDKSFPAVLIQAMSLGKLIIAADTAIVRKYVSDKVNGYLFLKENVGMLKQILFQTLPNGKMSPVAEDVAVAGKELAKNLLAYESIEGYAFLLQKIIKLPSEFATTKTVAEIPSKWKKEWRWDLFSNIQYTNYSKGPSIVDELEGRMSSTLDLRLNTISNADESLSSIDWAEEKLIETLASRKRLLEEEIRDRSEQFHGTWEDVYRNVKKAERIRADLNERDEKELERTGQPLCIYEPYFGEGTWPFLHLTSLYLGIGLTTKGRRPEGDDIDASSRLPILSNAYYRDALGEYGAFFAIANRVDRVHKNAWIGFQSWRAVAIKASLTKKAESVLLHAIESRRYGDAMYFWVRMDDDTRNPGHAHFWSFCDAINAGNCRFAFRETLRRMYGMPPDWDFLPSMPADGGSWSVMHSWALPTKSFMEFVMFARMFVDALDSNMYDEHHQTGHCYLSLTKDRHCYSRVLELLVNVWAYHSARRMIYLDPKTGAMQEHHPFKGRKGKMWIKWFSFATLKTMDEDRAEEWDSDHPNKHWLWPSTGEVVWQGMVERERNMRQHLKERRKQQSREKIKRIRSRARQKTLGKYIKPPPEYVGDRDNLSASNVTAEVL